MIDEERAALLEYCDHMRGVLDRWQDLIDRMKADWERQYGKPFPEPTPDPPKPKPSGRRLVARITTEVAAR